MSSPNVCLVCLTDSLNLYLVVNPEIIDIYETITKIKLKNGSPPVLCYICLTLLQKCNRFIQRAQESNNVFKEWISDETEFKPRPLYTYTTSIPEVVDFNDLQQTEEHVYMDAIEEIESDENMTKLEKKSEPEPEIKNEPEIYFDDKETQITIISDPLTTKIEPNTHFDDNDTENFEMSDTVSTSGANNTYSIINIEQIKTQKCNSEKMDDTNTNIVENTNTEENHCMKTNNTENEICSIGISDTEYVIEIEMDKTENCTADINHTAEIDQDTEMNTIETSTQNDSSYLREKYADKKKKKVIEKEVKDDDYIPDVSSDEECLSIISQRKVKNRFAKTQTELKLQTMKEMKKQKRKAKPQMEREQNIENQTINSVAWLHNRLQNIRQAKNMPQVKDMSRLKNILRHENMPRTNDTILRLKNMLQTKNIVTPVNMPRVDDNPQTENKPRPENMSETKNILRPENMFEAEKIPRDDNMLQTGNTSQSGNAPLTENLSQARNIPQSQVANNNISVEDRATIVALHSDGFNLSQIADYTGFSINTVRRWVRRYQKEGSLMTRARSGRPKLISQAQRREMVEACEGDGFIHTRMFADRFETSVDTVRRALHDQGIHRRRSARKPRITQRHKDERLKFAQEYLNFDWDTTVFTDEMTIELTQHGRLHLWRRNNTRFEDRNVVANTESGRIGMNMWGWISAHGPGELAFIPSGADSSIYEDILNEIMLPTVQTVYPTQDFEHVYFVQDNCLMHRSHNVRDWFSRHPEIKVIPWPAKSPDLNPIENIWALMVQRWEAHDDRRPEHLQAHCMQLWESLRGTDECASIIGSMRRRLQACINNNGGYTKYYLEWFPNGVVK